MYINEVLLYVRRERRRVEKVEGVICKASYLIELNWKVGETKRGSKFLFLICFPARFLLN